MNKKKMKQTFENLIIGCFFLAAILVLCYLFFYVVLPYFGIMLTKSNYVTIGIVAFFVILMGWSESGYTK
jgi:DMSO/TMAO reductase YedYZ heme-binding membrane subunit